MVNFGKQNIREKEGSDVTIHYTMNIISVHYRHDN